MFIPPKNILKAWHGREKLWKVFFLYQPNVLFIYIFNLALEYIKVAEPVRFVSLYIITACFLVWVLTAIWNCAFNTGSVFIGYAARVHVIVFTVVCIRELGKDWEKIEMMAKLSYHIILG